MPGVDRGGLLRRGGVHNLGHSDWGGLGSDWGGLGSEWGGLGNDRAGDHARERRPRRPLVCLSERTGCVEVLDGVLEISQVLPQTLLAFLGEGVSQRLGLQVFEIFACARTQRRPKRSAWGVQIRIVQRLAFYNCDCVGGRGFRA